MNKAMQIFRKALRLRGYLAFAFLLWSIVPHFQLITHTHTGGEKGHFHADLSKGDIANANLIFNTLEGVASSPEEKNQDINTKENNNKRENTKASANLKTIFAGVGLNAEGKSKPHSHYSEEANLASLASQFDNASPELDIIAYLEEYYQTPSVFGYSHFQARAPPLLSLS